MYLGCKAKRIFDVAGIGAEVMCFKCCVVFFKKHKYRLKNGWDALRASRFFGALPIFSLLPSFSRPCFRLAFSRSCLAFSRSSLARVSRSLARLLLVSPSLALSRSSLALSRSSLASIFWFESMICVYDV